MPGKNSEGSIYQRKDGRWCACLSWKGNRKYFYGQSEKEVKKKLKEFSNELARHGYIDLAKGTVGAMILDWLETDNYISLKPKSYETKRYIITRFIIPNLGDKKTISLQRADIQQVINRLSNQYSWSTVKKVHDILNQWMKSLVLDHKIFWNPVEGVCLPRKTTKNCKKIRFFTEDELRRILDTAIETYPTGTPVTRLGYAFHLLAYTGMRVGEALALTWEDIDFDHKTINVDKNSVTYKNPDDKAEKRYLTEIQDSTKTLSGTRIIPMSQKAERALREIYKQNGRFEFVLSTETGQAMGQRNLARAFSGIQSRADIQNPGTLHSLRHTFATRLIECGVDIKTVSTLLGHSDINITYNTYVHVIDKQKVRAIAELDEI